MSIDEKAVILLTERRVQIAFATDQLVQGKVRGYHGVYDVRWTRNQGWDCTCPAYGRCSHQETVAGVTMRAVTAGAS